VSWPFSRRLEWSLVENRLAEAEARARRRPEFIDLTVSNPTVVGLQLPDVQDLARSLGGRAAFAYTPAPRGLASARHAVATTYADEGLSIAPENIVLTASSSESYAFLFKLLGDPGDAVLVPAPSYPLFDYLVRLEGLHPIPYHARYEPMARWHLDLDSLDAAWAAAAREARRVCAVVTVTPNNPTGAVLTEDEAAALDARCLAHGAALIADEVFSGFVRRPAPSHVRCLAALPMGVPTFSLGGLSKSCGLPQIKVGWIALGGPACLVAATRDRLELIADTYLSVNAPAQDALPDLLRLGSHIRAAIAVRLRENEDHLRSAVGARSPLSVLRSDGGWSAVLRVPEIMTDEEWALGLIERAAALVQPGFFFDLERGAYLVVSLLPEPEVFAAGLGRLIAYVEAALACGVGATG